jgi:predicted ATPase
MKGIGFENMKVFKKAQYFNFKNITLLTGTNNSGKSSIINAMQMLQENLKATNIDELLKTEFKLVSNQNKYGSISNFINNESKLEDNYFVFKRKTNAIEYTVKIEVIFGLESYGSVKQIIAKDIKSSDEIFNILVEKQHPNFQCSFSINYKYFIDRFNKKCEKTEILRNRISELDEFSRKVKEGEKSFDDFVKFSDKISNEVSVYISIAKDYDDEIGEDYDDFYNDDDYFDDEDEYEDEYEDDEENNEDNNEYLANYNYTITGDREICLNVENQNFDEVGVFLTEKLDGLNMKYTDFISQSDYETFFQKKYKSGIFDFELFFKKNIEVYIEFENIICSYYKADYEESYKMFSDDVITALSNSNWKMKEEYSKIDPLLLPENIMETFISSLSDFGLLGSLLTFKDKLNNDKKNKIDLVKVEHNFKYDNESILKLEKENFFEGVYFKVFDLLFDFTNNKVKDISYKKFIAESVQSEIYSDIVQKIIKIDFRIDNDYVSSNRFTIKRAYNFNDNSDFSNLLKKVEETKKNNKEKCVEFINTWIKEFNIADELLLKPDLETGNFKAFLKIGEKETQLADFGLGTNQLLPIIFSLGIHDYDKLSLYNRKILPRTVVIEEPEANLHPVLQSKLADMFVDATNKFNVQIIVETHSEYIVRRMQFLVAKKYFKKSDNELSIDNDKVNIYYFNYKIDKSGRKAYEIKFNENGQLSEDFGTGFYDESQNLIFQLSNLNFNQSN